MNSWSASPLVSRRRTHNSTRAKSICRSVASSLLLRTMVFVSSVMNLRSKNERKTRLVPNRPAATRSVPSLRGEENLHPCGWVSRGGNEREPICQYRNIRNSRSGSVETKSKGLGDQFVTEPSFHFTLNGTTELTLNNICST